MSARTLACIIGWPVAQSLSPAIHNAAFEALGLDWTYVPLAVRPGAIAEGMRLLDDLGAKGANVTIPHKQAVVPFLARLEGDAATLQAVNTIVREGDALIGHNTDGPGFLAALSEETGFRANGKTALVLGAGGAARAVAMALARAGADVTITARRREQAAELRSDLAPVVPAVHVGAWGSHVAADLIVNATPARDGLPLDVLEFRAGVLAVDLIYLPPSTGFVLAARAAGAVAVDGLGMLVHQAALSFRIWTGRDAPIDVMREAARTALAQGNPPDLG